MSTDEADRATPQEESRLSYVYRRLCNFSVKYNTEKEIEQVQKELNEEKKKLRKLEKEWEERKAHKKKDMKFSPNLDRLHECQVALEQLKARLKLIEDASRAEDATISDRDIAKALQILNVKFTKQELHEMIWEVDEDADGRINWRDFQLMFTRNLTDKIGLEPARLFSLIQFMIYDVNENTHISVDETMIMLYARFGRAKMEDKLKQLFGNNSKDDLILTGKEGGEINFKQYLDAVNRLQKQKFWRSSIGELVLTSSSTPPSQKKMAREYIQATDGVH